MKNILKKILPNFLKTKIKSFFKKKKFKEFKQKSIKLNREILIKEFTKAGIKKGDILFVHSSLKGLGYIENGPIDIIDAFKEILTEEGTLIFPTFTIKESMLQTLIDPNQVFDPKSSVSTVGAITNAFLKSENVYRSLHPTHSVTAWGKQAKYITANHHDRETNFGEGTPFGKFLELNGKVTGLAIGYAHITYYHVYEDLHLDKFPEVYLADRLSSKIINHKGTEEECEILCHNPNFHSTRIEKTPEIEQFFRDSFEKNQLSHTTKIGNSSLWWIHSKEFINHIDLLYALGKTIYKIN